MLVAVEVLVLSLGCVNKPLAEQMRTHVLATPIPTLVLLRDVMGGAQG